MTIQRPAIISERVSRQRHRKRTMFFVAAPLLAISLFVGAVFLFRMETFTIRTVDVEGAGDTLKQDILVTAEESLGEHVFFFFPRRNVFLFKKNVLQEKIDALYPKVKTVKIRRVGLTKIIISIEERKPFALWCHRGEIEAEDCYFVDNSGYIFSHAPYFSNHVYLELYGGPFPELVATPAPLSFVASSTPVKVVQGKTPSEEPLGTQYIPEDAFAASLLFIQTLQQQVGLRVFSLTVHDRDFFELQLEKGGVLRFSPKQDPEKTVGDLKIAYDKKFSEQKEFGPERLEYIDVRFANKVLFKFVTENAPPAALPIE